MKKILLVSLILFMSCSTAVAIRERKSAAHDEFEKYERVKPKQKLTNIPCFTWAQSIHVTTQKDFDDLTSSLNTMIDKGVKKIKVVFAPGIYYFKDKHIDFTKKDYSNVSIKFDGNGAYFIGSNKQYTSGDPFIDVFDYTQAYIDNNNNPVSFWGKMHQTDRILEVVNKDTKLCRIHYAEAKNLSEKECEQVFIFTSQSFRARYFKVKYIKSGYLYFIADDLAPLMGEYNINFDYLVSRSYTRFKLCNIPGECRNYIKDGRIYLNDSIKYVVQCNYRNLFHFSEATFKYVEIQRFNVTGNRSTYKNYPQSLIYLYRCTFPSGFNVHDCSFSSLKSAALNANRTDNIQFSHNHLNNLYTQGVDIDNSCSNIYITHNKFSYCGLDLNTDGSVRCAGRNYYIGYNTFKNFGYSALRLGNYHENACLQGSKGVAEYNDIFYTDDYIRSKSEYTMMDGGAVYLFTQNEQAIIRYNKIYNYTGMYGNTGIYLDDGAYNVIVYGNIVLNILNDRNIYSRRKAIEKNPKSAKTVDTSNTGNVIMYNVVDGPCMFVANEESSHCYQGYNITFQSGRQIEWGKVIQNFDTIENDVEISVNTVDSNGIIYLNKTSLMEVKKMPTYKKIQRNFIQK